MTQCIDIPTPESDLLLERELDDHVRFVAIRNSDSELLPRVHQELIRKYFFDVNDIDSLTAMQSYIRHAEKLSNQCISYNVIAAIDSEGRLSGATVFGLFSMGPYTFIKGEYTVVVPEVRTSSLLDRLLHERYISACRQSILCGLNEPEFIVIQICSSADQPKNAQLQRMWHLRGFRRIDFPFIQLPLRDELDAVSNFYCYLQPLSENFRVRSTLTCDETLAIVDACCTFRESKKRLSDYAEYKQMKKYIEQQKSIRLCQ